MNHSIASWWRIRTVLFDNEPKYVAGCERPKEASDWMKRFSVNCGNGFYNLIIDNVTVTDTGEYECSEDGYEAVGKECIKVIG